MSNWITVAKIDAFPSGERKVVDIDEARIIVFNLNNEFYAIEDVCSHDQGELASGKLDDDEIICPRHGARFCIRNGKATAPPAFENIHSFPVRVEHGKVLVKDDRWDEL